MEDIIYDLATLYCPLSLGTRVSHSEASVSLEWTTASRRALWLDMDWGEDYYTPEFQLSPCGWRKAGKPLSGILIADWTDLLMSLCLPLCSFHCSVLLDLCGDGICHFGQVIGTSNDAEIQLFSISFVTLSLPGWLSSQSLISSWLTIT